MTYDITPTRLQTVAMQATLGHRMCDQNCSPLYLFI